MRIGTAAILAGLMGAAAAIGPATAQYDPAASRAENNAGAMNRSMMRQQDMRSMQQQNQFETNQLRDRITRQPPPITPPYVGRR